MARYRWNIFVLAVVTVVTTAFFGVGSVSAADLEEQVKKNAGMCCRMTTYQYKIQSQHYSGQSTQKGFKQWLYPIGTWKKQIVGNTLNNDTDQQDSDVPDVVGAEKYMSLGDCHLNPTFPQNASNYAEKEEDPRYIIAPYWKSGGWGFYQQYFVQSKLESCGADIPKFIQKDFTVPWGEETKIELQVQHQCQGNGPVGFEINAQGAIDPETGGSGDAWKFKLQAPAAGGEPATLAIQPGGKFCKGKSYWCFYLSCPSDGSDAWKVGYDCITVQTQTNGILDDDCNEFVVPDKPGDEAAPEDQPFSVPDTSFLNLLGTSDPAVLLGRAIKILLGIIGSIAFVIFAYGGFTWMTAAGNSARDKKAMDILVWGAIGVIVMLASYTIVSFLFDII